MLVTDADQTYVANMAPSMYKMMAHIRGRGTEADAGRWRTADGRFSSTPSVSKTVADGVPINFRPKRMEADAGQGSSSASRTDSDGGPINFCSKRTPDGGVDLKTDFLFSSQNTVFKIPSKYQGIQFETFYLFSKKRSVLLFRPFTFFISDRPL